MQDRLENSFTNWWNRRKRETAVASTEGSLDIGAEVVNGEPSGKRVTIDNDRRAESLALVGKSGSGKSSLICHLVRQDVRNGRGFVFADLHGEGSDFVLKTIADRERELNADLSKKVIVIDPTDTEFSVGLHLFESLNGQDLFVQIAAITEILIHRWNLDHLGARTAELLRNLLFVLAENHFTLVEIARFLRDAGFRSRCLTRVSNSEVKEYFQLRYDQASKAMQAVMSEPILNKTSFFIADPRFRHVLGQDRSTFSLLDAMDQGFWIILMLHKARLGPQAATLGALFFAMIKNALFARRSRRLFTLYADEIQNLITYGVGFETILSEARKFAVGVVSANQFLDQFPAEMRAAVLAVGTLACFQASGSDAQQLASIFDGGKSLAERLKNLPRRHLIVKTVHERVREAIVPIVREPRIDPTDLYHRSRARWARRRTEIEDEIRRRHDTSGGGNTSEALHGWD